MEGASAPPQPLPPSDPEGVFGFRFALIYGALGAVLVVAIIGVVVVARQPGPAKPKAWSSWRPESGSVTKMTQEIADHIAPQYTANAAGDELTAIIPSAPEVTKDTAVTKISTIGFRAGSNAQCCNRVVNTKDTVQAQFCGIGTGVECALTRGKAGAPRERLIRREALEMALYTFKYVPAVKAVIAYLPPPPGRNPTTLLYLERSNLSKELGSPLAATLPVSPPPLPTEKDGKESGTIDRLTVPVEYGFQFQPLPDGTEAMVLTPSSA